MLFFENQIVYSLCAEFDDHSAKSLGGDKLQVTVRVDGEQLHSLDSVDMHHLIFQNIFTDR